VESEAPRIIVRQPVKEPLQTGIKAIDSMIPIGRGQPELIIGDRGTGRTAIAIDTIINQKGTGVICVYVAIGQKNSTVASVVENSARQDAMEYTIGRRRWRVRPGTHAVHRALLRLRDGEFFMYNEGMRRSASTTIFEAAAAYRQLSLVLRRPPGRERSPADVFYLHSRLLREPRS